MTFPSKEMLAFIKTRKSYGDRGGGRVKPEYNYATLETLIKSSGKFPAGYVDYG